MPGSGLLHDGIATGRTALSLTPWCAYGLSLPQHITSPSNMCLHCGVPGRQETFMENYFASQRHNIFRNVTVLIYVFDVESRELEKDFHYYKSCLESIAGECAMFHACAHLL